MTLPAANEAPRFIWATRGRAWGFRFLRDGGFDDPLGVYEEMFSTIRDRREACRRVADRVALRFADPDGRRDASGRVIPHDFVLLGPTADGVTSLKDGRQRIWPEVAEEYQSVWNKAEPPASPG